MGEEKKNRQTRGQFGRGKGMGVCEELRVLMRNNRAYCICTKANGDYNH